MNDDIKFGLFLMVVIPYFLFCIVITVKILKPNDACLTGHDIDAKIQRDYQQLATLPTTPAEKDENNE